MAKPPDRTESIFAAAIASPLDGAPRIWTANAWRCGISGQSRSVAPRPRAGRTPPRRPAQNGPEGTGAYVPNEQPGAIIAGRYKLLQQIGEGGMGTVWMADQTDPVKRRVAVKLVQAERGQSGTILARFEAEPKPSP